MRFLGKETCKGENLTSILRRTKQYREEKKCTMQVLFGIYSSFNLTLSNDMSEKNGTITIK